MSEGNTVEVKFGSDTTGAEKGAQAAAGAVQSSVAQMRESFGQLQAAVNEMHSTIKSAFDGMHAAVAKFNNVMFAMQQAMQGGAMFKEFISATLETTKESVGMGKALGITATEASYLKVALTAAGISQETMLAAANKITMTLVRNEDAFKNLGVATRDADGHLLNTRAVLESTNERLREFREGTDRNVEGIKIYGRGWAEIAPLVNKFKGETAETREEAEKLNLVVGTEAVGAMADYLTATRSANEVIEGVKNTIGQALLPQMTALANWFRSIGPTAIEVTRAAMTAYLQVQETVRATVKVLWDLVVDAFKGIGRAITAVFGTGGDGLTAMELFQNALKVVQLAFTGLRIAIEIGAEIIRGVFDYLSNIARLFGQVMAAAMALDWAGVKSAYAEFKAATIKTLEGTMDRAVEIARKGREDMDKIIMGDLTAHKSATPIAAKEDGERSEGGKPKKETAAKSEMGDFKEQLRQKLEIEGNYFKDSTEQELLFWQDVQKRGNLKIEDARAIHSILFNLTKKRLTEEHAEEEAQIDAERALGKARTALKIEEINTLKTAGKLSDTEALQRIKAQHVAEAEADRAAIEQKLALYGTEAKERIKLLGQIQVEQAKADAVLMKDTAAITASIQKSWERAFAPIVSAFDQSVKGVIAGTLTIGKAIANLGQSMLTEMVSTGVKMVAHWAVTEAAKTGATATGTATRMALDAGAAAYSVLMSAGAAIKNILNYAWEAMAGAYKAIAGIPYVGPFLAPVAAGVAFAGVAAGVSHIASAAGGYDIPAGINPLTQLHEREMVLPQKQADAVRSMAEGKADSGGTIQISTRGGDFIHKDDLAALLGKLGRNFAFAR